MTFREFSGKNVEEAIRAAMKEFSADLGDLDIEILSQGKRGMLGVGGEEARILAAPKSAIDSAETVRVESPADEPERKPEPKATQEPSGAEPMATEAEADAEADAGVETMETVAFEDEPSEQLADLERAEAARPSRGGRTRGGRGRGRNGAEREYAGVRESRGSRGGRGERADRPPRADRGDRMREPVPFVPGKPLEELSDEERATVETAGEVLAEMVRLMGLNATVEIAVGGETARLNVKGDDLGALIGRRGEKLASLQHIVNLIVGRREGQHHRISVDVENYRGRREEQLRDVAERAAKRVIQTGKIIQLEAMPAVERRVVHLALVNNPRVRTQSVGVEPNRRIVVLPASQVKG
ncbi:MAG TPA: RNA-binding cell elongation regulator Jag/EloR [Candidatus Limnocylindria bacterium]|nr:RNA-binding cell elongation regulator Jag/EloR [Candidatus Limnocylindria bacterium]